MRVPISWLKDYVDVPLSVKDLAERLTLAGLEVEHIDYYGLALLSGPPFAQATRISQSEPTPA